MSATTEDIVLAAVGSIEPKSAEESDRDYQMRVSQQAVALSIMTGENSPVSKALARIQNCKVFPATVGDLKREKSSTRGVVKLSTKPSQNNPEGREQVRTERTDNPEGLAMAKRLTELKGHRVLLWIEVEEYDGGKVRVVRHVEDLGEPREEG